MNRPLVAACAALLVPATLFAADHAEAPGAAADPAADIADFYAWHTTDGNVVAVVTFAALQAPGSDPTWDADVLYGVHFDTNDDGVAEHDVWVRFGQNGAGDWGMQVVGAGTETLEGEAGTMLEGGGAKAWAGTADDPFFFDLQGYQDTLATGAISFDSSRDSLAGTNVTAIVLEFPAADVVSAEGKTRTWTTTGRL